MILEIASWTAGVRATSSSAASGRDGWKSGDHGALDGDGEGAVALGELVVYQVVDDPAEVLLGMAVVGLNQVDHDAGSHGRGMVFRIKR